MNGLALKLGNELIGLNRTIEEQECVIDNLELKAAMYKASFYHKTDIAEKLSDQIHTNLMSYMTGVGYRNVDDMYQEYILTEAEYRFCKSL